MGALSNGPIHDPHVLLTPKPGGQKAPLWNCSQIGDHRLSTSCGVVEQPNHHCGDDLGLMVTLWRWRLSSLRRRWYEEDFYIVIEYWKKDLATACCREMSETKCCLFVAKRCKKCTYRPAIEAAMRCGVVSKPISTLDHRYLTTILNVYALSKNFSIDGISMNWTNKNAHKLLNYAKQRAQNVSPQYTLVHECH